MKVKQALAEVVMRLQKDESEVDKVASPAVSFKEGQASSETVESMNKATTSASTKLSATAGLVAVTLKNSEGFLQEERPWRSTS